MGDAHGRDLADFRAYRCRVEYPVYGTQLCMTFRRPRAEA